MGRSPSTCFKIMACGGDSTNNGDVSPPPESKASLDKRRWSFRKRSSRHHVPNNNLISETLSNATKKEDQEAARITANSEKASASQKATVSEETNETASLPSAVVIFREPEQITDESTAKVDYSIHEDVVVVVQASIRGYLAKRELGKLKNVVKLQAVVRGYLVRRQAVGTLHCILAILKIQQLVRAHHSIQSMELTAKEKLDEETTAEMVKSSDMKLRKTLSATSKLVSNAFVGQLLQSKLKTKPIYISCNLLRPDSGWIWLERWMALTSLDQQKIMLNQDDLGKDMITDLNNFDVNEPQVTPEDRSSDLKLASSDPAVSAENEGHFIINSPQRIELEVPASVMEQYSNPLPQVDQLESHGDKPLSVEMDECTTSAWNEESSHSVYDQNLLSSDAGSLSEFNGNTNKPDYAEETPNSTVRRNELQETPETEVGHVLNGSRKPRNAAFAAVQAKFEELSSISISNRSICHASKDTTTESKLIHSQVDSKSEDVSQTKSVYFQTDPRYKEVSLTENVCNQYPVAQGDTLEGGPEILTTSIIDRSGTEIFPETRTSEGKNCSVGSGTNYEFNIEDIKAESNGLPCESDAIHLQIMARSSEKAAMPINTSKTVQVEQQSAELAASNIQVEDTAKDPLEVALQEGSPSSHVTFLGSRGTPSSEISIHAKTTKAENNNSSRKRRSQLVLSSSPTDSKNDSGAQTSGEHLQKNTKNVKRRNSPLMAKTDHVDHEHQTGSSNILPSYMQPTESARAKVNTSISQKSSPDLHDKNNHIKKRHSLPTGDGKQGSSSPRMQRSTSQAQQNSKANGIYSPQNSTERRWLR